LSFAVRERAGPSLRDNVATFVTTVMR
jgi:hypothetical protein